MLEVRRAMRRERIFRDRTNPLEIYDVLELIERFRCNETSVFVVSHELFHFFLHPEVIDEENLAFKITILFSYSSNNTTVALSVQFGLCVWLPRYNWNIVECGVKHHKPNKQTCNLMRKQRWFGLVYGV